MITNARPLQSEFDPADVVHRDAELTRSRRPSRRPRGAGGNSTPLRAEWDGKDLYRQAPLERLQEEVLDVNTQYVNCWRDYSPYKTLYRILEGLDQAFDIHRQSTPRDELLDHLHDYRGPPYVVVLDEVDQLEDRARWGLREDAITGDQLRQIAVAAGGDARAVIGILRAAARRAQQANLDQITDDIIVEAVPEAKDEICQKNVEKLTDHQKALYEIIAEAEEVQPPNLYERYRERVDDPKSDRTVRNYLEKMEHYNLVERVGANRGRTYRLAE